METTLIDAGCIGAEPAIHRAFIEGAGLRGDCDAART
jgi:hypothetical protein